MFQLGPDVRFALRRLRAAPAFALFAVVTLALGIGATTAIYSIIRAALAPPSGVTTLDRLVTVNHSRGGSVPMIALSYGDFQDLRARQTVFQDVAGWSYRRVMFAEAGESGSGWGEFVTGEYFQVLGVRAAAGRMLQPADESPLAPPVVVLSHGVWQRLFGGAHDVIGRVIRVNGVNAEIVGAAPPDFAGLFNNGLVPTAVWLPLSVERLLPSAGFSHTLDPAERSNRWVQVRARLKNGVTFDAAQSQVLAIAAQLDRTHPLTTDLPAGFRSAHNTSRPWVVKMTAETAMNEGADGFVRPMALVVMAAVGIVLLVACTNLANLMLARGATRRDESAVRLALGASRWRLVQSELMEAVLVAGAGGLAGVGVARTLLVVLGNELAVSARDTLRVVPRLDVPVLLVAAGATLLALFVAGLLPALQAARADVRSALASGGSAAALPRWRGRRVLIAAQVTVSMILVVAAGLFVDQLREQGRLDSGIDLERLTLMEVDFAAQQYPEARVREIAGALLAELSRRPDVMAAAVSSGFPIGITTPGAAIGSGAETRYPAELLASSPDIFDTLGVEIIRGRALTAADTRGTTPVAVLSERSAQAVFGTTDVVGRAISIKRSQWSGEPEHPVVSRMVVGVAADTDTGRVGNQDRGGAVFVPFDQHYEGKVTFSIRASGDPAALVPTVRKALGAIEPAVAVEQTGTGLAIAGPDKVFLQVTAGLTGLLGTFAIVLALVGLYGALSQVVARRRREIGLRMALGASRPDVVRMVLRDGLRPVLSGIVLGLVVGAIVRFALQPLFFRLLPSLDPFVLTAVPLLLLAAGALACLIPARRASNVDPNLALRDL